MKYKITIIVAGGNELKNDLEKGYIEVQIKEILLDEEILEFQFEPVE